MLVERQSPVTGEINSMELNITHKELLKWQNGTVIQKAMPNLTADEREFLITGLTKDDWETLFGKDEE
jgi:hypothetical protein